MSSGSNVSTPVVLVSGVASGIGHATARRFGAAGWQVFGIDQMDARGVSLVGDVADEATWSEAADRIRTTFGRLDGLVNNAGTNVRGSVEEADRQTWERILAVNLTSVFLAGHALLPLLRASRGAIVNVASGAGLVGVRRGAAYAASKGGVIALTRQMAVDYAADGVRVNAVCPGVVDTPLVRRLASGAALAAPAPHPEIEAPLATDEHHPATPHPVGDDRTATSQAAGEAREAELRRMAEGQLLGRMGTADEIATVIWFLMSPDAAFMTGAIVPVDGGYTAR